jgi:hypothetical protein
MSVDVYETTRHPVIVRPDSVDGSRHLDLFGGSNRLSLNHFWSEPNRTQDSTRKEKLRRSAEADHFDLGSEGWYRQKQVV